MKRFIETRHLPPLLKLALKAPRALTAPLRLLPDFIIIGAQRCGSTSLYRYLIEHPCVAPAFRKEIHFFDRNFAKGLNWYREHFPSVLYKHCMQKLDGKHFLTGEASVYYMFHPHAPQRLFKTLPQAKLIAIFRNPAERAYSQYHHELRKRRETLSFEEAVEKEPQRLQGERQKMLADETYDSYNYRRYSYLSRGVYIDQLTSWMSFFPKEQILILRTEDFYANPGKILNQTLGYLNLPSYELTHYRKYNSAEYPKMDPVTRKRLIDYFRPHNQRLYELLGTDFGWDQ